MKTKLQHFPNISKKVTIAAFFVFFVFACSKNTDTPTNSSAKFCATINWSNTLGTSGYYKAALLNGNYGLTSASVTDDGSTKTTIFNRDASGHLTNGSGFTFTYDKDNLIKIVMSDGTATGSITFTFDTNGHLTTTVAKSSDDSGTSTLTYTYTYDTNNDPVKIAAHLIDISSSGTSTADYDITADYLTDKQSFLPLFPEITPFSVLYAYGYYLSKHLINKWVIKINGTSEDGTPIPTINFTQQYTYTYDANGYVATMVHTGNPNNIYTFTHSDCN
jgi:hypothetical protein